MPTYTSVPTLVQWQKDTAPSPAHAKMGPQRAQDPILTRIDTIITQYHMSHSDGQKWYLINDLMFCTDYWLKRQGQGASRHLDPARQPAVYALFAASADWLCKLFSCTINVLPRELEKAFGRELGYHGQHIDSRPGVAQYLTRGEVNQYRLMFRDGKAHQFPWWEKKGKKIVLAESSRSPGTYNPKSGMTEAMFEKNYSGFVMSMGRDLYMAPHFGCYGKDNFFHSSYLAGNAVMCAGSMLIENGVIKGIKTDSGHYRPTPEHLTNTLLALQMVGVELKGITCSYFDKGGFLSMSAENLLAARGNWGRIHTGQKQFEQHLLERKLKAN